MAIRNIVKRGDEALTKICRPVEKFDARLRSLLEDMANTMYKAEGVGLAAPQVGILRRMFVVDVGEGLIECVNPEFIEKEGEQDSIEGCLSCPDILGLVKRPQSVTLRALDRFGKEFTLSADGFLATALCHEYDHLDGKTIYETAEKMLTKEQYEEYIASLEKEKEEE